MSVGTSNLALIDRGNSLPSVTLWGRGVALSCCARLLNQQGLKTDIVNVKQSDSPVVVLGDAAMSLLNDCLFLPPGTLIGRLAHKRITQRIVAWAHADPTVLSHSAVAVGPGELNALFDQADQNVAATGIKGGFHIHATAPFPHPAQRHFGRRSARAGAVDLTHRAEREACWIESLNEGWLFLIPSGENTGWLLGVGGSLEELLTTSVHIAERVRLQGGSHTTFETAPHMLEQLSGPGWLTCGMEAIAFDPLCGDGTAQAVREAILASSVIASYRQAEDDAVIQESLLIHYHSMLLAAMRRHLRLCSQFYGTGGTGKWWTEQIEGLAAGFEWCTEKLAALPEPRYDLRGLQLVPRVTRR